MTNFSKKSSGPIAELFATAARVARQTSIRVDRFRKSDAWLPYYESTLQRLMQRVVSVQPAHIREMIECITDDDIIHQKGELPEFVVDHDGGRYVQRGSILQMKLYYCWIIDFIQKATKTADLRDVKLLDVGASSPLLFRLMKIEGVGLNISEGAVQLMHDGCIEARVGKAEDLPLDSESFDIVLCLNSFSHIDNPIQAMKELKRVSRRDVIVANGHSRIFKFMDYQNDLLGKHRWSKFRWDQESFGKLVSYCGLTEQDHRLVDFFHDMSDWSMWDQFFGARYRYTRMYDIWHLSRHNSI